MTRCRSLASEMGESFLRSDRVERFQKHDVCMFPFGGPVWSVTGSAATKQNMQDSRGKIDGKYSRNKQI